MFLFCCIERWTYLYGLSPECNRMWLLNEFGRPNCLPHVSHVYSLMPEWLVSCSFKSVRDKNPLPQTWNHRKLELISCCIAHDIRWILTHLPGTHVVCHQNGFSDAFEGTIWWQKISYKYHIDVRAWSSQSASDNVTHTTIWWWNAFGTQCIGMASGRDVDSRDRWVPALPWMWHRTSNTWMVWTYRGFSDGPLDSFWLRTLCRTRYTRI